MALVNTSKGKHGYIDTEGKLVINPQFSHAGSFAENVLAAVRSGNKWGFIDINGKYAINPQFDDAESIAKTD